MSALAARSLPERLADVIARAPFAECVTDVRLEPGRVVFDYTDPDLTHPNTAPHWPRPSKFDTCPACGGRKAITNPTCSNVTCRARIGPSRVDACPRCARRKLATRRLCGVCARRERGATNPRPADLRRPPRMRPPHSPAGLYLDACQECGQPFGVDRVRSWYDINICGPCLSRQWEGRPDE